MVQGYIKTFPQVYLMPQKERPDLDELITPDEREHLLYGLHRFLVWGGRAAS